MSAIDVHSDTWLEIERWARAELAGQMAILRDPDASHDKTQVARGEVRRLEALLALPIPKSKPKIQSVVNYET